MDTFSDNNEQPQALSFERAAKEAMELLFKSSIREIASDLKLFTDTESIEACRSAGCRSFARLSKLDPEDDVYQAEFFTA